MWRQSCEYYLLARVRRAFVEVVEEEIAELCGSANGRDEAGDRYRGARLLGTLNRRFAAMRLKENS